MQINKLCLNNFRCFDQLEFTLPEKFTLLLGDNGSGKTALIEALRIAIGAFLLGVDAVRTPSIQASDIREQITPDNLGSVIEPPQIKVFAPAEVRVEGRVDGQPVSWVRRRKQGEHQPVVGDAVEIKRLAMKLAQDRSEETKPLLPLLAYYPAKRLAIHVSILSNAKCPQIAGSVVMKAL